MSKYFTLAYPSICVLCCVWFFLFSDDHQLIGVSRYGYLSDRSGDGDAVVYAWS